MPWALFYLFHQKYSIDITLHQTWYDERLRYNASFESFVLHGNMTKNLWIPDTFFKNSMNIDEHSITTHSRVTRIYKDGKVLFIDRYVKPLKSHPLGLFLLF